MKNCIYLFLLVVSLSDSLSQTAPSIQWQNTIGGSALDELSAMQQTSDGGYILGGTSLSNVSGDKTENSNGMQDYWIVKTDASGNIQWQNTIGGSDQDFLTCLQQTSDGGYILGGYSRSGISGDKTESYIGLTANPDFWIIKTDSLGAIQWQNTIGGNNIDWLLTILQTTDEGYILGGYSWSDSSGDKTENSIGFKDYWIVKTDTGGAIQWQNTIGGSNSEEAYQIIQTADGGYLVGGASLSDSSGDKTENSNGSYDLWIVKMNSTGIIQWQNAIGGSMDDYLYAMTQATDGGFVLGATSASNRSGDKSENRLDSLCISSCPKDFWIVKTDSLGVVQWENTIGGNDHEVLYSIQQTEDNGFIFGGISESDSSGDKNENSKGGYDTWLVKTDSSCHILWQKTIGGASYDGLFAIGQTADSGYAIGARSQSNISGDKTENSMGSGDYWLIKLAPPVPSSIQQISPVRSILFYPNPVRDELNVTGFHGKADIAIFDMTGRVVKSVNTVPGNERISLDVSTLIPGIYFVEIYDKSGEHERILTGRFVKE